MATAIIGRVFTFQVIFLNSSNVPFDPIDPTITVFSYNMTDGSRTTHVDAEVLSPGVPSEEGRFVHNFTLPGTLEHGQTLYADFRALDQNAGNTPIMVDMQVECQVQSSLTGGLRIQFVR